MGSRFSQRVLSSCVLDQMRTLVLTMRMIMVGLSSLAMATAVTVGISVSGAQTRAEKPDFSGEWTLNRQASTLGAGASAVRSGGLRIEHREPMFRCRFTVVGDGKPVESAYELSSDGREVTGNQQGRATVSSLRWDGEALVFTGGISGPNVEMTISFRYELLEGGQRLRAVERIRGGGRDQDNIWVFERP